MAKRTTVLLERLSSKLTEKEKYCLDAYVVNGDKDKAYVFSREEESRANEKSLAAMATRWINSEPVAAYVELVTDKLNLVTRIDDSQHDETDILIEEITLLLKDISGGGDKRLAIQAAKELANLHQLKSKTKEEAGERKTYYLPLRCEDCAVYKYVKENVAEKIEPNNN